MPDAEQEREQPERGDALRRRILDTATELLEAGGVASVSTRAVAAAADTQPPAIYRVVGDKRQLLDAVAEHGFARYLDLKPTPAEFSDDPLDQLRAGWDLHIDFGLKNPALFMLMYGDPAFLRRSPAVQNGIEHLRKRVNNIAAAGLLTVPETAAIDLIRSTATGVVLTLLEQDSETRKPDLSRTAREMVLSNITGNDTTQPNAMSQTVAAANALLARSDDLGPFTAGERQVLNEWLQRIVTR